MRTRLIAIALLGLSSALVAADEVPSAQIASALSKALPGLEPDRIDATPVPGLYQVTVGSHVLYVSEDGRYLIRGGELFDVERRVNLTEDARRDIRLAVMGELDTAALIVFAPPETRHAVTVFTDVDCPYCARLHEDMEGYNALGIEVRYAAFPRAGIPSSSYDKTVSVWCSDDPHVAIGDAKAGRSVERRSCENPVKTHFDAGRRIGIRGTPAFVLSDGSVVPGYVKPARLAEILEEQG